MYQTEFKTYKFYNKQGKRLSVFGEVKGETGEKYLDIFILRCSENDRFQKSKAVEIYNLYKDGAFTKNNKGNIVISRLEEEDAYFFDKDNKPTKKKVEVIGNYHPQTYQIPLRDETKPRMEFMNFCFDKFLLRGYETITTITLRGGNVEVNLHNEPILI